jgi:hypothetical protein
MQHAGKHGLCQQCTYGRKTEGEYLMSDFERLPRRTLSILKCVTEMQSPANREMPFEHLLLFKVRTINVITFTNNQKYLQFAATSGKNGSQFLNWVYWETSDKLTVARQHHILISLCAHTCLCVRV